LKTNGFQVATIRLKATGKMEVLWNNDHVTHGKIRQLLAHRDNPFVAHHH
jgi:hypothetical protein